MTELPKSMYDWRKATPIYYESLSNAYLLGHGELFAIGDSCNSPAKNIPLHWHDTYEIGYVRSGHGVIVVNDREHAYNPGQIYAVNSMEPHMAYTDDIESVIFVVHFHSSVLDDGWIGHLRREAKAPFLIDLSSRSPLIPLHDPTTQPVRELLEMIRVETTSHRPLWDVVVGGMIIQAVGVLARHFAGATHSKADQRRREALLRIAPALRLIESNYVEPLSLQVLADTAHVSPAHCCVLFKAALGISPIEYRNSRRLTHALHLLQDVNLTIRVIAEQVGFSSVQEFNRIFRRKFGTTPRNYSVTPLGTINTGDLKISS